MLSFSLISKGTSMEETHTANLKNLENLPFLDFSQPEALERLKKRTGNSLTKTELVTLGKNILAAGQDATGNLVLVKKVNEKRIAARKDGVKLWTFDAKGDCVLEEAHELPLPYVHMLATGSHYFSISDQFMRGYAGFDYTRMFGEYDGPNFPKDQGRAVWVRLENQALWCANYAPQRVIEPTRFMTTLGMGTVTLENETQAVGLLAKLTLFVPIDDKVELLVGEITNISEKAQTIDVIPVIPIFGGNRAYVEYHRDVVRLYNKSRHDPGRSTILIQPGLEWIEGATDTSEITYWMKALGADGKKGDLFYSDRESFLGPDGQWREPLSLAANLPPRYPVLGKEAAGAIQFSKITLKPGESFSFVVATGIGLTHDEADRAIRKYDYKTALQAKEELEEFWKKRTAVKVIHSQDPRFDISWNRWWLYQLSMRYWFGNTGHPQFDYGSDFSGWREIWQDMIGTLLMDPDGTRAHLLSTLEGIRADGTNATRFFARTKKFGSDEVNGLWCDHPYWTTQTVWIFAQQAGELEIFLRGGIKYFKDLYISRGDEKDEAWTKGTIGKHSAKSGKAATGTVLEHLLTQTLPMFFDAGKNGLLSIKRADWNDAVDQTRGESVTFSSGLVHNLNTLVEILKTLQQQKGLKSVELFEELAALLGDNSPSISKRVGRLKKFLQKVNVPLSGKKKAIPIDKLMADLQEKAKVMSDLINKVAWNGEYYAGYFDRDGHPVDTIFSQKPGDFMMYLMPQAFAIFGGVAKGERLAKLIESVNKYLYDAKVGGYKLNAPPYRKFNKKIGRITGFAPGTKENNAIFNHANLFWMLAMLTLRRTDDAFKVWNGINPLRHEQTEALIPPFLPEYWISGDNENLAGKGEYPMLTGTGVWTRILFERYVLGVRGELDGLRIDPQLPAEPQWKNCGIDLNFRGARYEIRISNPKMTKNAAVKSLTVDGKKIEGNLVKPCEKGTHTVVAVLE